MRTSPVKPGQPTLGGDVIKHKTSIVLGLRGLEVSAAVQKAPPGWGGEQIDTQGSSSAGRGPQPCPTAVLRPQPGPVPLFPPLTPSPVCSPLSRGHDRSQTKSGHFTAPPPFRTSQEFPAHS